MGLLTDVFGNARIRDVDEALDVVAVLGDQAIAECKHVHAVPPRVSAVPSWAKMSYGPVAPVNLLALNADAGVRPHLGDEGKRSRLIETAPAQQGIGHHAGAVNPGRAVNQDRAAVIEHLRESGQRRQDRGRGFGLRRLSIFQGQPKPFDAGFCDPLPDEVGMFPGGLQGQHAVAAKQLHGGHRACAGPVPQRQAAIANGDPMAGEIYRAFRVVHGRSPFDCQIIPHSGDPQKHNVL